MSLFDSIKQSVTNAANSMNGRLIFGDASLESLQG